MGSFFARIGDGDNGRFPIPLAISATTNTLLLDWTLSGDEKGESLGHAVATAGDVNGDTYADILVGTPKDSNEDGKVGIVRLFQGAPGGLPTNADWTMGSDQSGSLFGQSVSSAGDTNNDGYDDIIIGAPHYKNGELESAEGRAYIFYGSSSGLTNTPITLEINQQDAQFGYDVSGVGDVNDDGYDDVLVGSRYYTNGEGNEGGAFLYLGSSSGITTTAVWSFEGNQAVAAAAERPFPAQVMSTTMATPTSSSALLITTAPKKMRGLFFCFWAAAQGQAPNQTWTLTGPHSNSLFGMDVASAGDVNQDGYDDMLIGAPNYSNEQENEGAALLYLGKALPLNPIPAWVVESNQLGALLGTAVSGAGDVNNDGYDDVIIGTPLYSGDQSHEGRATIFLGTSGGLTTLPAWHDYGDKADTLYGQSVSNAGNFNHDAYADILVGAPDFRTSRDPVGKAFAYLGNELSVIEYEVYLPLIQN